MPTLDDLGVKARAILPEDLSNVADVKYFDHPIEDVDFLNPQTGSATFKMQKLAFPVAVTALMNASRQNADKLGNLVFTPNEVFEKAVEVYATYQSGIYKELPKLGQPALKAAKNGGPMLAFRALVFTKAYNELLAENGSKFRLGKAAVTLSAFYVPRLKVFRGAISHSEILSYIHNETDIKMSINQLQNMEDEKVWGAPWGYAEAALAAVRALNPANEALKNENRFLISNVDGKGKAKALTDLQIRSYKGCDIAKLPAQINTPASGLIDLVPVLQELNV